MDVWDNMIHEFATLSFGGLGMYICQAADSFSGIRRPIRKRVSRQPLGKMSWTAQRGKVVTPPKTPLGNQDVTN